MKRPQLIVGQEIPITTGETLGSNNTNPFRQIERQDVGVQLTVTPQINDGDTIR
jgi:general secretion pathway protein D